MDNEFFLNVGFAPLLHMDPAIMPNWPPPPPSTAELNSPPGCFNNHSWEKSTDQYSNTTHFDSALSSMASSPIASTTTDTFAIGELIGKLGSIGSASSKPSADRTPPLFIFESLSIL